MKTCLVLGWFKTNKDKIQIFCCLFKNKNNYWGSSIVVYPVHYRTLRNPFKLYCGSSLEDKTREDWQTHNYVYRVLCGVDNVCMTACLPLAISAGRLAAVAPVTPGESLIELITSPTNTRQQARAGLEHKPGLDS